MSKSPPAQRLPAEPRQEPTKRSAREVPLDELWCRLPVLVDGDLCRVTLRLVNASRDLSAAVRCAI
jgi:hypothetical protein